MSSIITVILKSAVGLLGNKARDKTVEKLRHDVTDAQVREIVVRELNDIKTKLDGISRKDLLSSVSFLREGIELLYVSLDRSTQEDRYESSAMSSDAASARLNETLELTRAVENIKCRGEYKFAKERFKDARRKATEAFFNEALKIEDRIFAAKLRIASEILENLESPKIAVTGCLSFLRDVHNLPAIREIFSVYLNGGIKSLLGKQERAENVKSVMMINSALFQFLLKFGSKRTDRLNWPAGTIELADRCSFNPILEWHKISSRESMEGELGERPNELVLDEFNEILFPRLCGVNSHGDIIAIHGDDEIKIISSTGETKVVKLLEPEGQFVHRRISTIAVDKDDVIHAVSNLKTRTETHAVREFQQVRFGGIFSEISTAIVIRVGALGGARPLSAHAARWGRHWQWERCDIWWTFHHISRFIRVNCWWELWFAETTPCFLDMQCKGSVIWRAGKAPAFSGKGTKGRLLEVWVAESRSDEYFADQVEEKRRSGDEEQLHH